MRDVKLGRGWTAFWKPSDQVKLGSFGMAMYYWSIQQRAAEQVVRRQMPVRMLVVRVILFAEIASSLLMIQLGQYTHWAMCFVPFFLMSMVAMNREKWDQEHWTWDPRVYFLSMLTPKNFSLLGLRQKQKGALLFVSLSMAVRLACVTPLLFILASKCASTCFEHWCFECERAMDFGCPGPQGWQLVTKSVVECGDRPPEEWVLIRWELAKRGSSSRVYGYFRHQGEMEPHFPQTSSVVEIVPREVSEELCPSIRPQAPYDRDFELEWGGPGRYEWWQLNVSNLCQQGAFKIPGMLSRPCQNGGVDPVQYLACRTSSWLPGG